jgi:NADH-quinone oxidoreductase E subunit
MARLTPDNVQRARDLIAVYPVPRSALIPILHLAQEQDGWLTPDAMAHVAELLDLTTAEVYGTASFYDMFFTHPVGTHLVSICTNIACLLNGGYELLEHAEQSLGVRAGATTEDGQFTLEEVECIADCGRAPCLAVNWRFFGNVSNDDFDRLVSDLRSGALREEVPAHGTLNRVRRDVTAWAGGVPAAQAARQRMEQQWAAAAPTAESAPPTPTQKDQRGERQPESQAASQAAPAEAQAIEDKGDTAGTVEDSRHQKGGDTG